MSTSQDIANTRLGTIDRLHAASRKVVVSGLGCAVQWIQQRSLLSDKTLQSRCRFADRLHSQSWRDTTCQSTSRRFLGGWQDRPRRSTQCVDPKTGIYQGSKQLHYGKTLICNFDPKAGQRDDRQRSSFQSSYKKLWTTITPTPVLFSTASCKIWI